MDAGTPGKVFKPNRSAFSPFLVSCICTRRERYCVADDAGDIPDHGFNHSGFGLARSCQPVRGVFAGLRRCRLLGCVLYGSDGLPLPLSDPLDQLYCSSVLAESLRG